MRKSRALMVGDSGALWSATTAPTRCWSGHGGKVGRDGLNGRGALEGGRERWRAAAAAAEAIVGGRQSPGAKRGPRGGAERPCYGCAGIR